MPAQRFADQLNTQIGNELAAHNQYLAVAVHYDALTMPRMAAFFYAQAVEERTHAMMMVQYLLDTDADVVIPGVEAPVADLRGRRRAGAPGPRPGEEGHRADQRPAQDGREESDFASEQFMQWFIKEQVEEVATMSDLLAVVERNKTTSRTSRSTSPARAAADAADPTAPRAAGA